MRVGVAQTDERCSKEASTGVPLIYRLDGTVRAGQRESRDRDLTRQAVQRPEAHKLHIHCLCDCCVIRTGADYDSVRDENRKADDLFPSKEGSLPGIALFLAIDLCW